MVIFVRQLLYIELKRQQFYQFLGKYIYLQVIKLFIATIWHQLGQCEKLCQKTCTKVQQCHCLDFRPSTNGATPPWSTWPGPATTIGRMSFPRFDRFAGRKMFIYIFILLLTYVQNTYSICTHAFRNVQPCFQINKQRRFFSAKST